MEYEDKKRIRARQQCLREAFRQLDTMKHNWIDRVTVAGFLQAMKISRLSSIPFPSTLFCDGFKC